MLRWYATKLLLPLGLIVVIQIIQLNLFDEDFVFVFSVIYGGLLGVILWNLVSVCAEKQGEARLRARQKETVKK